MVDGDQGEVTSATGMGFAEVYAAEYAPMVRLAFFLVGSVEVAEEVVQDAFVRLHQRWDAVDRPGAFVRRCVVNGCTDRQRRRRRWGERLPAVAAQTDPVVGAPGDGVDARLELVAALGALPVRCRTAVVLRFLADLSEAQTAEAMGVAPGTVKALVHRGLERLRTEVER